MEMPKTNQSRQKLKSNNNMGQMIKLGKEFIRINPEKKPKLNILLMKVKIGTDGLKVATVGISLIQLIMEKNYQLKHPKGFIIL